MEIGPGQVDGSSVPRGPRADDNLGGKRSTFGMRRGWEGIPTTLECIFELFSFLSATGAIVERYKAKVDATETEGRMVLLIRRDLENRIADYKEDKADRPEPSILRMHLTLIGQRN